MDNGGQGTCTLCVSRLYRRAIGISDIEVVGLSLLPAPCSGVIAQLEVGGFHIRIQRMEIYVGQERARYTSYKVANLPIEFSRSIPRAQLRPGYGDGFRGAPLEDRGLE